jgi:hypothetical protein
MDNKNLSSEALLSNNGDMTSFRYGNSNIRFRTPKCLKRYTEVKEWDNGYIVCIGHSCYWAGNKPDLPVMGSGEIVYTRTISPEPKYYK